MSWFHDIIAAKLEAVRTGRSRRVIINMPPRHLKSHLASVCFPAWCLGHDPSAQLLCVSYAQDLADKLSRDCRQIVARNSPMVRRIWSRIASGWRSGCKIAELGGLVGSVPALHDAIELRLEPLSVMAKRLGIFRPLY